VKPSPVIVTGVPPTSGPSSGVIDVTTVPFEIAGMNVNKPVEVISPFGVTSVIGTEPVPAEVTAVIEVSEVALNVAAGVSPKRTAVTSAKPEPVNVTVVPPASGPWLGVNEVIPSATYVKSPGAVASPYCVPLTVTGTAPVPAGVVATISVSETTLNSVHSLPPKVTLVAPVKPVPVMVTGVPPASGPLVGVKPTITVSGLAGSITNAFGPTEACAKLRFNA